VEHSIAAVIDWVDDLETGLPLADQVKLDEETHEDNYNDEKEEDNPFNPPPYHHDGITMMTSRCTKSFHILCINPIGKVWEVTLNVALLNSMLTVMMILLLKFSLVVLPVMVCMMLKLI
jgi:hypothetical protein